MSSSAGRKSMTSSCFSGLYEDMNLSAEYPLRLYGSPEFARSEMKLLSMFAPWFRSRLRRLVLATKRLASSGDWSSDLRFDPSTSTENMRVKGGSAYFLPIMLPYRPHMRRLPLAQRHQPKSNRPCSDAVTRLKVLPA